MRSSFIVGCLSLSFFVTPASPACGVCSFQLPILQLSSNPPTSPPSASVLRMQFQAQCITPLNAPSFRPYPVSRRRLCMLADDARQGEESRKKSKVQKGKTRDDALREIRSQQIQLNKMLSACGSPKEIFETVSLALDTDAGLNAVNLATALHRLSRTSSSSERRALERSLELNRLLQLAHAEMKKDPITFDERGLVSVAWSLSRLSPARGRGGRGSAYNLIEQAIAELLARGLAGVQVQGLCNLLSVCAGGSVNHSMQRTVARAVAIEVEERGCVGWKPQDLSIAAWGLATLDQCRPTAFERLREEVMRQGVAGFRSQGLTNFVWACATCAAADAQLTDLILREVEERSLATFSSQEVANLFWAIAVLDGQLPSQLCDALESWMASNSFSQPQELSIMLWSLAKSGRWNPLAFDAARDRILSSSSGLADFSPQSLSNIVWALATVNISDVMVLQAIEDDVVNRGLQDFKEQEIANMVWGFAKSGVGGQLIQNVGDEMRRRRPEAWLPQHLSNIAWACATRLKLLFRESVASGSEHQPADGTQLLLSGSVFPEPVTDRLDAAGKHGRFLIKGVDQKLLALCQSYALTAGLDSFNALELSLLAWSAVTGYLPWPNASLLSVTHATPSQKIWEVGASEMMMAVRQEMLARQHLSRFSSAALVNIAWAFAKAFQGQPIIAKPAAVRIDAEFCERGLDTLKSKELSNLLWAFAKLGINDAACLKLAVPKIHRADLSAYSEQSLAMIAWSLAISSNVDEHVLTHVLEEVQRRGLQSFQNREINAIVLALNNGKIVGEIWETMEEEARRRASLEAQQLSAVSFEPDALAD